MRISHPSLLLSHCRPMSGSMLVKFIFYLLTLPQTQDSLPRAEALWLTGSRVGSSPRDIWERLRTLKDVVGCCGGEELSQGKLE